MTRSWEPGTSYSSGDKVTFQGKTYKIIQAHTSQNGWEPTQTPALWGAVADDGYGQQQQQQSHQQQSQQPQQQQQQWQQKAGGEAQQVQSGQQEQEQPQKQEGLSTGMKIAGGLLAGAAALGVGALAYNQYNKHQEHKQEQAWSGSNWEQEAGDRTKQGLAALQSGSAKVAWVLVEGNQIPQNAIPGGSEKDGEPLYIVRAFHESGVHLGKVGRHMQNANIAYGGKEIAKSKYEVLVGNQAAVKWVDRSGALLTQGLNLVEGGREPNGQPLYIAQAAYKGGIVPGKAGESLKKGAAIPYGGDEEYVQNYRVLTYADSGASVGQTTQQSYTKA